MAVRAGGGPDGRRRAAIGFAGGRRPEMLEIEVNAPALLVFAALGVCAMAPCLAEGRADARYGAHAEAPGSPRPSLPQKSSESARQVEAEAGRAGLSSVVAQHEPRDAAADAPQDVPAELAGAVWRWVALDSPGRTTAAPDPSRYTLAFVGGGRVAVRADCNRGAGAVVFPAEGALQIQELALTRVRCPPGSLGDAFARDLARATSWEKLGDELRLRLPSGEGSLRFTRRSD
jgi:heat shock protein HslJ